MSVHQSSPASRYTTAFLVALVLVVLGVIITVFTPSRTDSGSLLSAKIDISNNSFSPVSLLIKPGTTVTWSNLDQVTHQVAADPYPVDNGIPNFDNGIVMQPHDTYSFTFTKKGTYSYHDEKNPFQLQGTIVVK